jgi:hypothetical protein
MGTKRRYGLQPVPSALAPLRQRRERPTPSRHRGDSVGRPASNIQRAPGASRVTQTPVAPHVSAGTAPTLSRQRDDRAANGGSTPSCWNGGRTAAVIPSREGGERPTPARQRGDNVDRPVSNIQRAPGASRVTQTPVAPHVSAGTAPKLSRQRDDRAANGGPAPSCWNGGRTAAVIPSREGGARPTPARQRGDNVDRPVSNIQRAPGVSRVVRAALTPSRKRGERPTPARQRGDSVCRLASNIQRAPGVSRVAQTSLAPHVSGGTERTPARHCGRQPRADARGFCTSRRTARKPRGVSPGFHHRIN